MRRAGADGAPSTPGRRGRRESGEGEPFWAGPGRPRERRRGRIRAVRAGFSMKKAEDAWDDFR